MINVHCPIHYDSLSAEKIGERNMSCHLSRLARTEIIHSIILFWNNFQQQNIKYVTMKHVNNGMERVSC
jgi:hypothetical protein